MVMEEIYRILSSLSHKLGTKQFWENEMQDYSREGQCYHLREDPREIVLKRNTLTAL